MADFDPVKKDDVKHRVQKIVWTTKSIERAAEALGKGQPLVASPFLNGNVKLLKPDLVYKRTPEEIEEWVRCKDDLVYFVEKYCKVMTPEGIRPIKLRPYQQKYLECLRDHNLTIYLSCRQCGKCFSFLTPLFIRSYSACDAEDLTLKNAQKVPVVDKLTEKWRYKYYNNILDCYEVPFFEIYNLFNRSLLWKLKYKLYTILWKLQKREHAIDQSISSTKSIG